jgi:hypothetical protein
MLMHVSVCWMFKLQRSSSCRIMKFDCLQCISVRTGIAFLPQVCCVVLLGSSVFLSCGQLGKKPRRLGGD